jgi:hypothetical protein
MSNQLFTSKHRVICLLGCGVLCAVAFTTLAQETGEPANSAAVLDFQKPDKIVIDKAQVKPAHELAHTVQQRTSETGDPDRPIVSGDVPNPEPRASGGFIKIGDIEGESEPESNSGTASGDVIMKGSKIKENAPVVPKKNVPAHTPEWTDTGPGDPG